MITRPSHIYFLYLISDYHITLSILYYIKYFVLYCIALHCIALHCIALYCIVLYKCQASLSGGGAGSRTSATLPGHIKAASP